MLRELPRLCRVVDAVSLFGSRRPSIIQRHFLRACSSHRSVASDSPAAAVKDPRWVMLNLRGRRMDDSFVPNAKTVAISQTSTGEHLRASLGGAALPASSFLYYDLTMDSVPGEEEEEDDDYDDIRVDVVAAHADSVLLRLSNKHCMSAAFEDSDYFVYRAGAAGPPSLSLLPDREFLTKTESGYAHRPRLYCHSTGLLLRRGENDDDLLVVQLELWYNRVARQEMVEFCVLRLGASMRQWELMEPVPIVHDDDKMMARRSSNSGVFTVGDRYLCWVDYESGFFLCDMADDARPKVRYAPLPTEVRGRHSYEERDDDLYRMKYSMKMGSAGSSKVRFISIDPHCCCGAPCRSTCAQSHFAFTVTTWTMDLSMDVESPLTWVKEGEIDCEEVWTLPGYEGLPRAILECPVISLDNPKVVCFLVSNCYFTTYEDQKVWMIQLNMRSKTLMSVVQSSNDPWSAYHRLLTQLQY